ncbi:MAG: NAD(P)/FAD-dependent oxidoreductase [Desulfobulbus sp.]|jgi:thioredoxin reductase (NADPH)
MSTQLYDVVIIGSGPAGIQAGIHAARRKTRVLMLGRPENSALYRGHIENYACIPGVSEGPDLLQAGIDQVKRFGVEVLRQDALKVEERDGLFSLEMENGQSVQARSIVLCMGVAKKNLGVPGEQELLGRGVSYCVDCDANFYRGAEVVVTGHRSAAVDGALTLLSYAAKVYLVTDHLDVSPELLNRLQTSPVEYIQDSIKEIRGEKMVESILLNNGTSIAAEGVFIELGSKGALQLATQIGVHLDSATMQYIAVKRDQATNIPGIYAAGDITGPPLQMAKAVGEGCVAGMEAAMYARKQASSKE